MEVGDLMLVGNVGLVGKNKLAYKYLDALHQLVAIPDPGIPVYKIEEVDGTWKRVLYHNLLLPIGSVLIMGLVK